MDAAAVAVGIMAITGTTSAEWVQPPYNAKSYVSYPHYAEVARLNNFEQTVTISL